MVHAITTLTLNPALDVACDAPELVPVRKIRTSHTTLDPAGGGVNVARVLHELGGDVRAVLMSGGVIGSYIEDLLRQQGIAVCGVPIAGTNRISMAVRDMSSGQEYRFLPAGPQVSLAEFAACRAAVAAEASPWLVLSGSLPPGVPVDGYAEISRDAARRGQQVVLDAAGPALRAGLGTGLALIKPSLEEFEELVGCRLPDAAAQDAAALGLVRQGAAARIAVSLGEDGAMLATADGVWRMGVLPVKAIGAVGAGDSFVAAMVLALSRGAAPREALAWGSAAGAAAVTASGTAHPPRALVETLYQQALSIEAHSR